MQAVCFTATEFSKGTSLKLFQMDVACLISNMFVTFLPRSEENRSQMPQLSLHLIKNVWPITVMIPVIVLTFWEWVEGERTYPEKEPLQRLSFKRTLKALNSYIQGESKHSLLFVSPPPPAHHLLY